MVFLFITWCHVYKGLAMTRKILITSTDLMMVQFLMPHVINLSKNGYVVEVACSEVGGRMGEVRNGLAGYAAVHAVRLQRSPLSLGNARGYVDLKKVIDGGHYDIIWTNEPVMGVMTRLAARRSRRWNATKVLYMAHGFHFYRGAPKVNWMLYYPIERIMSREADVICTINNEDNVRSRSFPVDRTVMIHGIGINVDRLSSSDSSCDIRQELGLAEDTFIVLSVGELNPNKNQKAIIRALSLLDDPGIHYVLCGRGNQVDRLEALATSLGMQSKVHCVGYRRDVANILRQSDVLALPSYREGLPLAALEAMYVGLPLVTSNIRGPVDFMENGVTGYCCNPDDVEGFAESIRTLRQNDKLRQAMGLYNQKAVKPYCLESVKREVLLLINSMFK